MLSNNHLMIALLGLAGLSLGILFAGVALMKGNEWRTRYEQALDALEQHMGVVDPWELQRKMMGVSSQHMPTSPTLHEGTVLYAALNMEELGETLEALSHALAHHPCVSHMGVPMLSERFLTMGRMLQSRSVEIRDVLKKTRIGTHRLTRSEAKALFDGTTDLTVTNCGFALACGLPAAAGYAEVQNSNLSKRNPATGKIDKTQDGKWIKGVNYVEPDLGRVLALYSKMPA